MHYKNGREAKNGDKVIIVDGYAAPCAGVLYDATAGNDFCNGKLAITSGNDAGGGARCCSGDDVKNVFSVGRKSETADALGEEIYFAERTLDGCC